MIQTRTSHKHSFINLLSPLPYTVSSKITSLLKAKLCLLKVNVTMIEASKQTQTFWLHVLIQFPSFLLHHLSKLSKSWWSSQTIKKKITYYTYPLCSQTMCSLWQTSMFNAKYKTLFNFLTHLGLCMTTKNFLITTMQYIPV